MIGVLDYGAGNTGSAINAFERIGERITLVKSAREINQVDALVITGVGSFSAAMEKIEPMRAGISDFAASGRPVLGICLGMQVLFEKGEENKETTGLGLMKGRVEKMLFAPKLPHVGWNQVRQVRKTPLFDGMKENEWFYFIHSFACEAENAESVIGTSEYGREFVCAVGEKNVFGVQFHPEKSSSAGQKILENFVKMR